MRNRWEGGAVIVLSQKTGLQGLTSAIVCRGFGYVLAIWDGREKPLAGRAPVLSWQGGFVVACVIHFPAFSLP
jgi:hypothetical protein